MNPLKRIKQFHDKNKQYDGFVSMEVFTAVTLLSLVINFCCLTRDPLDWMLTVLLFEASLVFAMEWCCNRKYKDHADFMKEILASDNKALLELSEQLITEHARLVSANRRRKRAERQLKWYRHALCAESATRLGLEMERGLPESFNTQKCFDEKEDMETIVDSLAESFLLVIAEHLQYAELTTDEERQKHIRRFGASITIFKQLDID